MNGVVVLNVGVVKCLGVFEFSAMENKILVAYWYLFYVEYAFFDGLNGVVGVDLEWCYLPCYGLYKYPHLRLGMEMGFGINGFYYVGQLK